MKVNSFDNRDISFQGFWTSKTLKKGLEFAEKNGALFASTTTLALSAIARPISILSTPKTDKENKRIACAKSISSSITDFVLTYAISKPIVNAIISIDKNPRKFLNKNTIRNLQEKGKELTNSKPYILATQLLKLGLGFAVILPKAILTAMGIPHVMSLFFKEDEKNNQQNSVSPNEISFKGKNNKDLPSFIAKILNNKSYQDFSKKNKDSNFPMHIIALKDALATGAFIHQANNSKQIKEERKAPLIYNSIISTGLSITSGYVIDNLLEKPCQNFIKKYSEINKSDPNLEKQLRGFKITKPVLIIGTIYYIIIPVISTFIADRIKNNQK